jgi:hypothetical protein
MLFQQTCNSVGRPIASCKINGILAHARSARSKQVLRNRSAIRNRLLVRCSADPDDLHEAKLGPNVAAGIKDVKENLTWSPATVIRNEYA